jgi:hypothetical protein
MDTNQYEKELERLGAFEIAAKMLKLAKNNEKNNSFLNAGRGNPNWINTQARLAFPRFMAFGVKESERTMLEGNLAGYTTLDINFYSSISTNKQSIALKVSIASLKICFSSPYSKSLCKDSYLDFTFSVK